jgi:hypothetical protein
MNTTTDLHGTDEAMIAHVGWLEERSALEHAEFVAGSWSVGGG